MVWLWPQFYSWNRSARTMLDLHLPLGEWAHYQTPFFFLFYRPHTIINNLSSSSLLTTNCCTRCNMSNHINAILNKFLIFLIKRNIYVYLDKTFFKSQFYEKYDESNYLTLLRLVENRVNYGTKQLLHHTWLDIIWCCNLNSNMFFLD